MYTVYVRISPRSGNPEVWAYEEQASACALLHGSLVTGGLTRVSKASGYGIGKYGEKVNEGYRRVSSNATFADIEDAKTAIKGGSVPASGSAAYTIYSCAMSVWGRSPKSAPATQAQASAPTQKAQSSSVAPSKPASTPIPAKVSEMSIGFVRKNEANSAWAW